MAVRRPPDKLELANKMLRGVGLLGAEAREVETRGHWCDIRYVSETGTRERAFTATFEKGELFAVALGWPV